MSQALVLQQIAIQEQPWLFRVKEQLRLRLHLCRTELALRAVDTSHLTPKQQAARLQQLDALHTYWVAGVFPRNVQDDYTRPAIKDDRGVLCAMAYLIATSGYSNFVDHVAKTNNHVYINDIHDGPLLQWLDEHGLTQAEAARIQPAYGSSLTWAGLWVLIVVVATSWLLVLVILQLGWFQALKRLQGSARSILFWFVGALNAVAIAVIASQLGEYAAGRYKYVYYDMATKVSRINDPVGYQAQIALRDTHVEWITWIVSGISFVLLLIGVMWLVRKLINQQIGRRARFITHFIQFVLFAVVSVVPAWSFGNWIVWDVFKMVGHY